MHMQLYDVVRIVRLSRDDRQHDIAPLRPPAIGDVGTVVDIPVPDDPQSPVLMEAVDDDARTLWLAEFDPSELESVE